MRNDRLGRQLFGAVVLVGVFFSMAIFWACQKSICGGASRTSIFLFRQNVVYDKAIIVNSPEEPYRGVLRFEASLTSNQGKTELIVTTIRTDEMDSVLYAQHIRVQFEGKSVPKAKLTPLQASGMICEFCKGGVAIGTLRYRVESDEIIKPTDIEKLTVQYLNEDYPLTAN